MSSAASVTDIGKPVCAWTMPFTCQPPTTCSMTAPMLRGVGSSAPKLTTKRWRTSNSASPLSSASAWSIDASSPIVTGSTGRCSPPMFSPDT